MALATAIMDALAQSTWGWAYRLSLRPGGTVLNDARPFFSRAWRLATFLGLVIMLVVLSVNSVGEAIRDLNDLHEYGSIVTGA